MKNDDCTSYPKLLTKMFTAFIINNKWGHYVRFVLLSKHPYPYVRHVVLPAQRTKSDSRIFVAFCFDRNLCVYVKTTILSLIYNCSSHCDIYCVIDKSVPLQAQEKTATLVEKLEKQSSIVFVIKRIGNNANNCEG